VGAEWPLTRKFGCESRMAVELLIEAKRQGLRPVGVSFHVGSQQTDPGAWAPAIAHVAWIFRACAHRGLALELLNLGGGLPAQYRAPLPSLAAYAETIETALAREFGSSRPRLIVEPGRYLVGDAALLRTEILLISRKSPHEHERWIYLDAGVYNGLDETLGERIHYRIRTPRDGGACGPVILAGPTCDSTDILYAKSQYQLPLDLEIGDAVDFLSTGAYTASCAAVEFNGFPPIASYFV
jgi:ornithine decarboxylase